MILPLSLRYLNNRREHVIILTPMGYKQVVLIGRYQLRTRLIQPAFSFSNLLQNQLLGLKL